MRFTIVVTANPNSAEGANTALRFCRAATEAGHDIVRLFFFADGVHNANALAVYPQDETGLPTAWQLLVAEKNLDAVVCVSSALKRGILNAEEAKRAGVDAVSVQDFADIGGLGQLVDAVANSDRCISF